MAIGNLAATEKLKIIGLMSGTSFDGLDICYTEVRKNGARIESDVLTFSSCPYSKDFKDYLKNLCYANVTEICEANFKIAHEWSKLIDDFIHENDIKDIDLIGSHGQTVWHIHGQSSLQIGEASVLAHNFNVPVIADFRVMDIAAGGSGAPLVPFVDYLWFKEYHKNYLLLNIGGIANFTIIPENCRSIDDVFALDTGPGNGLIDAAVSIFTNGNETFDKDAKYGDKGQINGEILSDLMNHEYFSKSLPKSTGKEEFGENFVKNLIQKYQIDCQDDFLNLITTLTRFTAETIHLGYKKYFGDKYSLDEIVIAGGGANNSLLVKYLHELFDTVTFESAEKYNIDAESKEAHAFAILAAMRVWNIPANVPNVTGAEKTVLLGKFVES